MTRAHQIAGLFLCICTIGCVRFQEGPSPKVAADERLVLPGRGQVRVIDLNPTGPAPILLVHGYGASSASFRPVMGELAATHRVLAIDLPGFGRSDALPGDYSPSALADVLAEVLDRKGIHRVDLVGHSWGASVALAFALRHPDRLDRLVIVSGWIFDEQLLPLMRWARAPGLGEALYALFYREAIGERMYLNFYDPRLVTEEVVDEVERQMGRDGALAAALAAARGMGQLSKNEPFYREISVPTLLIWGREDRVSRPGYGERLARELPRAELVELPRCGHIPMWECRGETLIALQRFLAVQP